MISYSNPRLRAEIADWPSGRQRVTAVFEIEQTARGERATRKTTGAVKKLTFASRARIVDGSDGKTYILEYSKIYVFLSVMRGDMKFQQESISPDNPRYEEMKALLDS